MEILDLAILCVTGLLTSMLSAVVGMAGGITLLSVMLLFFEPLVAIPIHGVVQLVSNSSRTFVQRKHIDWRILGYYSAMLIPIAAATLTGPSDVDASGDSVVLVPPPLALRVLAWPTAWITYRARCRGASSSEWRLRARSSVGRR